MKFDKLRLAEVIWDDAHVIGGGAWTDAGSVVIETAAPQRCRSVGYVIHNTPAIISLAPSAGCGLDGNVDQLGPVVCIPRGMVVRQRFLK